MRKKRLTLNETFDELIQDTSWAKGIIPMNSLSKTIFRAKNGELKENGKRNLIKKSGKFIHIEYWMKK